MKVLAIWLTIIAIVFIFSWLIMRKVKNDDDE